MSATMVQEVHLSDRDYERFRNLILERSGLHFPEKRRQDLRRGLLRAFSDAEHRNLDAYYDLLTRSRTDSEQWERLICQITIGETHFFRNQPQFQALRDHILPQIIQRKRPLGLYLRIWSAGCATGEEPYSIAMLLRELLPDLSAWNITILASDINREALKQARWGQYGNWSFREKGWEQFQARYFKMEGKRWVLSPLVREMVTFAYLNLVEDPYPSLVNNTVAFDLIICRNVTIYFTPEITQRVVDQLYEALVEDGWLIVGHSEPSPTIYARFEPRNFPGAVLYQKTDQPPVQPDFSWLEKGRAPSAAAVPLAPLPDFSVALPDPVPPCSPPMPQAQIPVPADSCAEARGLLDNGRVEEALELLHQVLEMDRDCAPAYYLLAKARADAGYWGEARHWCEKALEFDPLLTEAYFLLGLIHGQEDNFGEALAAMKRVVYLERKAVLGHFWLANLYQELGDVARSRKSFQNTVKLLEELPPEAPVLWSDGMTAGRLLHTVRQFLENDQ